MNLKEIYLQSMLLLPDLPEETQGFIKREIQIQEACERAKRTGLRKDLERYLKLRSE